MNQEEVRSKVEKILDKNMIGTLATVKNDKPFSRYMTFFNDDYTLYCATTSDTHKVEDIEANNNVHILLGYDGEGFNDAYLEIEGTAEIKGLDDLKHKFWLDKLEKMFTGPDDSKFVVLVIKPDQIRLMNAKEQKEPHTLEL